jgi:class 3 adenylate cyclase
MTRDASSSARRQLVRASLDDPSAARTISRGAGSIVHVGPLAIGRARLEPGWRWSDDVKPAVGTELCEVHHLHVLLAGRFAARMADGETAEFGPGDVFDIPPGHDAWVVGDEPVVLLDVSGNVAEFGQPGVTSRAVMTLLMSDIVESTPMAARLGDAAWRQVLADHNRIVRSQVGRFRGREIDTTGDGFLLAFDSAAAALESAKAIRDSVRAVGLQVRIGVHTGEVEMTAGGLRGIAVHTVARVMAAAGPSQIFMTAVTRTLAEGASITARELGRHELKGIPTPVELFSVE